MAQSKQKQAERRKRRSSGFKLDFDAASQSQQQSLPTQRRGSRKQRSNISVDDFANSVSSGNNDNSPLPEKRGRRRSSFSGSLDTDFGVSPRKVSATPQRNTQNPFQSPKGARSQLQIPAVAEAKEPTPIKTRQKPFTSPSPAETKSRPSSPIMPSREEIATAGGGGAREEKKNESRAAEAAAVGKNPDYVVGDTDQVRKFNQAIDLITTTYEMSMATARAEGAIYSITPQFRQEISRLLGTHNFNANTKNLKQIADWMKKNKPRPTDIETRGTTSPRGTETRPASATGRK
jgi:hypothetical protein